MTCRRTRIRIGSALRGLEKPCRVLTDGKLQVLFSMVSLLSVRNTRDICAYICGISGFDWQSLLPGGIVVDVGGGIGSTSMLLATAFSSSASSEDGEGLALRFIIQDRPVVCEMGEKV